MSYEIIYDKQFVKVNEKTFIPMILSGSNNCTEYSPSGRERRERSWGNLSFLLSGGLAGSMEEMLKKQAKYRADKIEQYPDEYTDSQFGYYSSLSFGGGCKATYGQYTGIVKTGCKKALTVEQLAENNVTITIYTWNDEETQRKIGSLEPLRFKPNSTQELEDFLIGTAPKYLHLTRLYARFNGMQENTPKRIRRKYFAKEKTERQEVRSKIGYTIKITNKDNSSYGYLYSFRGGSFRYSPYNDGGQQFLIKKDAETIANKMKGRRSSFNFIVEQVEYNSERLFRIPAGKKVVLPKKEKKKKLTDKELINSLYLRKEGEEVANMFNPSQKCFLEPLAVALHDFIKGCEITGKSDSMQQALKIFRTKYPEEYYVLLD